MNTLILILQLSAVAVPAAQSSQVEQLQALYTTASQETSPSSEELLKMQALASSLYGKVPLEIGFFLAQKGM